MRENQPRSFEAEISRKVEVGWKGSHRTEPPEAAAPLEQIGDRTSSVPTARRKTPVYPRLRRRGPDVAELLAANSTGP